MTASAMHPSALSTPALLVDRPRLDRNLSRMQAKADANEVALRPHIKTHKSVALARRQRAHGANGLTVATVAEAETFVEAGGTDVRVAYPVTGRDKHKRLQQLRDDATISFTVDSVAGVEHAAAVYPADDPIDILLEVDVGHGRCGVHWTHDAQAVQVARRTTEAKNLHLAGILTHAGQAYSGPSGDQTEAEALTRAARHERDRMLSVAATLADAEGTDVTPDAFDISIGSTPTMAAFENAEHEGFRVTEIRPGNYVVHDAMQVALGAASLDDCALTVCTTVVSVQEKPDASPRAFVDAGKKIFTTDTGYGTDGYGIVLASAHDMQAHSGLRLAHLSEEHGWLDGVDPDRLSVGDRLQIVPNHACVTLNNQNQIHVVDDNTIVDTWSVTARGG